MRTKKPVKGGITDHFAPFDLQMFANVYNYNGSTLISGTSGYDYIYNYSNYYTTIDSGDGDDNIDNYYSYYTSINSGSGNDYITSYYSYYTTIDSGDGDDYIYNYSYNYDYTSINGGAGDDTIYNSSYYSTITGGSGNDRIEISSNYYNVVQYTSGNDTIVGLGEYDTLLFDSMLLYTFDPTNYTIDGSDVVLNVGSDSIRIVDGNGRKINIVDMLLLGGIDKSKGKVRTLIEQGSISLDGKRVDDTWMNVTEEQLSAGVKIRKGKKTYVKFTL